MFSSPDSQTFTRLLISAGTLLLIAAFVVPGLILRETGVLTIPRDEIRGLTPTAENEIARRQEFARDAGAAAPYVGALFLLSGALLLGLGVPRLRRLEQSDDERRRMELDKLRGELRPQSAEERERRLRQETDESETSDSPPTAVNPSSSPKKAHAPDAEIRLREASEAQRAVLNRIAELAPPLYDFESQVALSVSDKPLLLDGLLITDIGPLPDIVVEIKYIRRGITEVARRVREAKLQLLDHLTAYRRPAIGWLIVVTEEPMQRRAEIEAVVDKAVISSTSHPLSHSVISLGDLDQLRLPI